MTVADPTGWQVLCAVEANHDSRDLWRQPGYIFRIRARGGQWCAPGAETMQTTGLLLRRDAVAKIDKSVWVRREPLSEAR